MRQFDEDNKQFQKDEKVHHRNVLLVVTGLAAAALVVGVVAAGALDVLRAGAMLGALFSVIWALMYDANAAGKGAIFVAALVVLILLSAVSTDPSARLAQPYASPWLRGGSAAVGAAEPRHTSLRRASILPPTKPADSLRGCGKPPREAPQWTTRICSSSATTA